MFTVWVCFGFRQANVGDRAAYFRFRSAVDVTNCLLLINFATNVVLYCAINVHFRRVVRQIIWERGSALLLCKGRRRPCAGQSGIEGVTANTVLMKPTQQSIMYRTEAADAVDL